ncbi:hypothetical protein RA274_27860, partial [Pseudomonas syringae pv. tagetis]|uniref:hypothetical protein n=1 Tax=Pseudomonas syringae group genomosp. 7 TaxID=251699 RepID=UPI0037707380
VLCFVGGWFVVVCWFVFVVWRVGLGVFGFGGFCLGCVCLLVGGFCWGWLGLVWFFWLLLGLVFLGWIV